MERRESAWVRGRRREGEGLGEREKARGVCSSRLQKAGDI